MDEHDEASRRVRETADYLVRLAGHDPPIDPFRHLLLQNAALTLQLIADKAVDHAKQAAPEWCRRERTRRRCALCEARAATPPSAALPAEDRAMD